MVYQHRRRSRVLARALALSVLLYHLISFSSPYSSLKTSVSDSLERLKLWADENEIKMPKCELKTISEGNRGVVVTADLNPGDIAVSVPEKLVLTPERSKHFKLLEEKGFCHGGRPSNESCGLVLSLMLEILDTRRFELMQGRVEPIFKSNFNPNCNPDPGDTEDEPVPPRFAEYIDNLNPSSNHPLLWTERELGFLNGTSTLKYLCRGFPVRLFRVNQDVNVQDLLPLPGDFNEWFWYVVKPFFEANSEFLGSHTTMEELADIFRWSVIVVSSSSFDLGRDRYQGLVPVWDMVNHASRHVANVQLTFDNETKRFEMSASKHIKKGEQLLLCYGKLPNSELLRRYAIIDEEARDESLVDIPLELLIDASNLTSRVHDHLSAMAKAGFPMQGTGGGGGGNNLTGSPGTIGTDVSREVAESVERRVEFLVRCKLIPGQSPGNYLDSTDPQFYHFSVNASGYPDPELLESLRILMLSDAEYHSYINGLDKFLRQSLLSPIAMPEVRVPPGFKEAVKYVISERLRTYAGVDGDKRDEEEMTARKRLSAAIVREEQGCLKAFQEWLSNTSVEEIRKMSQELWECIAPQARVLIVKD